MSTLSYWNLTAEKSKYPRLETSMSPEILILGGGITGITCAYCLAEKGLKPIVIEAGGLCDGTTGNTTGKVTIQHGDIYSSLNKKYGFETAKLYADSQTRALEFVEKLVKKETIDCQFTENTAYLYASPKLTLKKSKKNTILP